jgi:hypothetical protein
MSKTKKTLDPWFAFRTFNTDQDPRLQSNKNYKGQRNNDRYYSTTTYKVIEAVEEKGGIDEERT